MSSGLVYELTTIYDINDTDPKPIQVDYRFKEITVVVETLDIPMMIYPEIVSLSWEKFDEEGTEKLIKQQYEPDEFEQTKLELKREYFERVNLDNVSGVVSLKLQPPYSFRVYDVKDGDVDLSDMHFLSITHQVDKIHPVLSGITGCTHISISVTADLY